MLECGPGTSALDAAEKCTIVSIDRIKPAAVECGLTGSLPHLMSLDTPVEYSRFQRCPWRLLTTANSLTPMALDVPDKQSIYCNRKEKRPIPLSDFGTIFTSYCLILLRLSTWNSAQQENTFVEIVYARTEMSPLYCAGKATLKSVWVSYTKSNIHRSSKAPWSQAFAVTSLRKSHRVKAAPMNLKRQPSFPPFFRWQGEPELSPFSSLFPFFIFSIMFVSFVSFLLNSATLPFLRPSPPLVRSFSQSVAVRNFVMIPRPWFYFLSYNFILVCYLSSFSFCSFLPSLFYFSLLLSFSLTFIVFLRG